MCRLVGEQGNKQRQGWVLVLLGNNNNMPLIEPLLYVAIYTCICSFLAMALGSISQIWKLRPGADLGFAQSPRTQGPRHPATVGRHAGPSEGIETPGSVCPWPGSIISAEVMASFSCCSSPGDSAWTWKVCDTALP